MKYHEMFPPLTLQRYEALAARTVGDSNLAVLALGMCGESGEFADLVKKHIGHGHELDRAKALKECGDTLWYVAMAARQLGSSLEEVAIGNIRKLEERYPNGFSSERSINREESK